MQRSATASVFSTACGWSANASFISAGVRKWRPATACMRFSSLTSFPVWMQISTSWASVWSGDM